MRAMLLLQMLSTKDVAMLRAFSAAFLAMAVLTGPALAQKMDCDQEFLVRVNKMHPTEGDDIRMPTEDMVAITRFTLMGYDACKQGNMEMARKHFDEAMRHMKK
jgi:hypothetical protein